MSNSQNPSQQPDKSTPIPENSSPQAASQPPAPEPQEVIFTADDMITLQLSADLENIQEF